MAKAVEHHKKKVKEYREAWDLLGSKWAHQPKGPRLGAEVTSLLQQLAKAAAEHAASMRVYSAAGLDKRSAAKFMEKQKKAQDEHWQTFEAKANALKEVEGVLTTRLRECACCLLWRACWHSAVLVGDQLDEADMDEDEEDGEDVDEDEDEDEQTGDEDEEDEDEDARFGEHYPGSFGDAVEAFGEMLDSLRDCFWESAHSVGVRLDLSSISSSEAEAELADIASVRGAFGRKGLNAVRLVIPSLSREKDPRGEVVQASLSKAKALGLRVHLELPGQPNSEQATRLRSLAEAAAPCAECVQAISLPGVTDLGSAAASVAALRRGGWGPERCSIYCAVPGGASEDDEGEWAPAYSSLMRGDPAATDLPLLLQDGNIMLEGPAGFPADEAFPDLQSALDAASHRCEDEPAIALVSSLSLRVPAIEKPKQKKDPKADAAAPPSEFYAEFFQRLIGSAMSAESGFFFEAWLPLEGDAAGSTSLKACLEKGTVDLSAEGQVMHPAGPHKASLVYLHGFMCSGYDYLVEPEIFYRPKAKKKAKDKKGESTKKSKSSADEDEDEQECEPWPGLKVICPSAPTRSITAHDGEESPSWYDYLIDNDGEAEDDQPIEDLEEQTRRIHAILDAEVTKVGSRNVFLGGASQGCGMAMHAGLSYPQELGGLIGTMGQLMSATPVTPEWVQKKVPVYCYIGLDDTTMPWDKWVGATWQRIEDAGAVLQVRKDEGKDHGEGEAEWVRSFLSDMLRPSTVKTTSASAKKKGKR